MTTEEIKSKTAKPVLVDAKQLSGVWQLRKKLLNSNGSKSFGGHLLASYRHPLTSQTTFLYNVDGQKTEGFFVEKLITFLKPDENPEHRLQLMWLLAHPEVNVEGVKLTAGVKKNGNAPFYLKNLDNQAMDEIEDLDAVDIVIGRLSEDVGPKSIGLKRLRWLLAYFNLPYFEMRYIKNPDVEKKMLRAKIKNWSRKPDRDGKLNGLQVADVLDHIDSMEMNYLTKEMMRHNLIILSNGSYKYSNVPIGTNIDSIIEFFKNTPNIYNEIQSKLLPLLKEEGFKV